MLITLIWIVCGTAGSMLAGAGVLNVMGRLGARWGEVLSRAPGLDLAVGYFTIGPLVVGPIVAGWVGLGGAVAGQVVGTWLWCLMQEAVNPNARRGPRIIKVINRLVGRWRNHLALWLTAAIVPVFWLVRLAEVVIYPPITWLVGLPRYRQREWVSVSRQKFAGLVGHDLLWCLYCDWMTGVWSLGSEMLRNVESFWCPIRFQDPKKCANCRGDFPDVDGGWVDSGGTMEEVTRLHQRMYPSRKEEHAWFGHPTRLTVEGR